MESKVVIKKESKQVVKISSLNRNTQNKFSSIKTKEVNNSISDNKLNQYQPASNHIIVDIDKENIINNDNILRNNINKDKKTELERKFSQEKKMRKLKEKLSTLEDEIRKQEKIQEFLDNKIIIHKRDLVNLKTKNDHLKVENNKIILKNQIREQSFNQYLEYNNYRNNILSMLNNNLLSQVGESNLEDRIINDLYPNPDTMSYEQLLELGDNIGSVSRALNPELIKKIKIVKYNKKDIGEEVSKQERCSICFEDFKKDDNVKMLKCNHIYHPKCIDFWLGKEKKCPFCKEEIVIKSTD